MRGGICRLPKCTVIVLIWFLWVSLQTRKTEENCWERTAVQSPIFPAELPEADPAGAVLLGVRSWHEQELCAAPAVPWLCSSWHLNSMVLPRPSKCIDVGKLAASGFVPLPHGCHMFCHSLCLCRGVPWLLWNVTDQPCPKSLGTGLNLLSSVHWLWYIGFP